MSEANPPNKCRAFMGAVKAKLSLTDMNWLGGSMRGKDGEWLK